MKANTTELLKKWEDLLKIGQNERVARELVDILPKSIDRADRVRFSRIAREAGQGQKAVRALFGVVREPELTDDSASAEEKLEYALALLSIGAESEAISIAETVPAELHPHSYFVQAEASFRSWNFAVSLTLLRRFLEISEESPFRNLAKVKLLATLIFTNQIEEARDFVEDIKRELHASQENLLLGRVFELEAQIEIMRGNYGRARELLDSCLNAMAEVGAKPWIYTKKWKTIIDLKEAFQGSDLAAREHAVDSMERLRADALAQKEWGTLRICDVHYGAARQDFYLLNKAFYGTPHFQHRKMLATEFPDNFELQDYFCFGPLVENPKVHQLFHLERGECLNGEKSLKQGQVVHRLLKVLASDFYTPFSLASIFSRMFPENHYSPDLAPDRVYQAVKRFRQWCEEVQAPFEIDSRNEQYQLNFTGDLVLIIPKTSLQRGQGLDFKDYRLESLFREFQVAEFSAKDAATLLDTSARTVNRLLKEAITEGHVETLGAGSHKKYKIVA